MRFTFAPPVAAWSLALGLLATACLDAESNEDTAAEASPSSGESSSTAGTSTTAGVSTVDPSGNSSTTDLPNSGGETYAGPGMFTTESSTSVTGDASESSESSSESGTGDGSSSSTDEGGQDDTGPSPDDG